MIIFLIGFMGAGKTTVGKKLANKMSYTFIDTDQMIEKMYNTNISTFFENKGENEFRKIERKVLLSINGKNKIVSTGGGTPCYLNNMEWIKKNGISIYLELNTKALFDRLKKSKIKRPLIKYLDDNELYDYISDNLKKRESYYLQSNINIKGVNLEIDKLKNKILNYSK